jgi:hypothetical protein
MDQMRSSEEDALKPSNRRSSSLDDSLCRIGVWFVRARWIVGVRRASSSRAHQGVPLPAHSFGRRRRARPLWASATRVVELCRAPGGAAATARPSGSHRRAPPREPSPLVHRGGASKLYPSDLRLILYPLETWYDWTGNRNWGMVSPSYWKPMTTTRHMHAVPIFLHIRKLGQVV